MTALALLAAVVSLSKLSRPCLLCCQVTAEINFLFNVILFKYLLADNFIQLIVLLNLINLILMLKMNFITINSIENVSLLF